jgi:inosose dehydratase
MNWNRRKFLQGLTAASLTPLFLSNTRKPARTGFPVSCSSYDWITFYKRAGKTWWENPEACAADFVTSGLKAIEPNIGSASEAKQMIEVLRSHDILMPSVYVNSLLHVNDEAKKSIDHILAIVEEIKPYGTRILVTNPTPISWGGKDLKSDAQLIHQAKNLDKLGGLLKDEGIALAYHTHDTEMMAGAREFHHMMQNTEPEHVAFCFDVHWIYRGSHNSSLAVFDVLKLYGSRVVELHVRQSNNGIWSETFGEGDIDYRRFASLLKENKIFPHIVIEQCVEDQTPGTLTGAEAHKIDLANIMNTFQDIL